MSQKTFIWLLCFLLIAVLSLRIYGTFGSSEASEKARSHGVFNALRGVIERNYVEEVEEKQLFFGAMKGMTKSLDKHSRFYDPNEYNREREETDGAFAGLGVTISQEKDFVLIISPLKNSPALAAGLEPGDRIIAVNGELLKSIEENERINKLKGPIGSVAQLKVERDGQKGYLDVSVQRDLIKIPAVREVKILEGTEMLSAKIPAETPTLGFIRLRRFQKDSGTEVKNAIQELQRKGMKGLILDLRNNGGGLLEAAVNICDTFIESGGIVEIRERDAEAGKTLSDIKNATQSGTISDLPLVILVNRASASASEIVSGCLKDHKRAALVGEKTYGKGSVQTIIPIPLDDWGMGGLKITTAKYYASPGTEIDGKGVTPHHELKYNQDQFHAFQNMRYEQDQELQIPEQFLERVKEQEKKRREALNQNQKDKPEEKKNEFYDLQLEKAIEVLSGMVKSKG